MYIGDVIIIFDQLSHAYTSLRISLAGTVAKYPASVSKSNVNNDAPKENV